jgi:hypothetical protein
METKSTCNNFYIKHYDICYDIIFFRNYDHFSDVPAPVPYQVPLPKDLVVPATNNRILDSPDDNDITMKSLMLNLTVSRATVPGTLYFGVLYIIRNIHCYSVVSTPEKTTEPYAQHYKSIFNGGINFGMIVH